MPENILGSILNLTKPFALAATNKLSSMKPSAWLLNFGRGQLVVDQDLIDAANNKNIAGTVLDVFRTEPLPGDH